MSARPKVSRKLVTDTAWALVGLGGPTVLQLLYVVAAARALGAEQFGQLMVCVAVATVASFVAGLGGDGVALKAVARDHESLPLQFGQALSLLVLSAIPVSLVAILLIFFLDKHKILLSIIICIVVADVLFGRIAMTCQKMFIALSQQGRAAISGAFLPLARVFSALFVFSQPLSDRFESFAISYLLSILVACIACYVYTISHIGKPRFNLSHSRLGEGISFSASWVNGSLQLECDKMILSYFTTPAAVGVYSLGSRLMDGAFNPPRALRIALQGRMMREGSKGHSAMYRFMLRILPISIGYGIVAWGGIAFLSPYFIHVFGPEYAELVRILPLLGALPLLRSIADIGGELFVASDRVVLSTAIQLATTALRIGIGILFVRSAGIDGAVASSLLSTAIAAMVFWIVAFVLHRRSTALVEAKSKGPDPE